MKPLGRSLARFRQRLLLWFRAHRRNHPWRRNRDPYPVWLAEVMLQQTRIAAVIPYYEKFLKRFPDVQALARAPEREVLRHWAGLGYYSRARNLRRAARKIVQHHRGQFPRSLEAALALPGIGKYTAAAVLSVAYGEPLPVLDGNVARVLARLGATRGDLRAPRHWRQLMETAEEILDRKSPGDWNEALMELGEEVCTPRSPRCCECCLARWCEARKHGLTGEIPAIRKKPAVVRQRIAAAVLLDSRGRTLLMRDTGAHDGVLFSRLWQFPAVEVQRHAGEELMKQLKSKVKFSPADLTALPHAKHSVTFRQITLLPFLARVTELPELPAARSIPLLNVIGEDVSSATRKIASAAINALGAFA